MTSWLKKAWHMNKRTNPKVVARACISLPTSMLVHVQVALEFKWALNTKQHCFFSWRSDGWKRRDSLGFYTVRVLMYNSDATMEVSLWNSEKSKVQLSLILPEIWRSKIFCHWLNDLYILKAIIKNARNLFLPLLVRMNCVCASGYRIVNMVLNIIKIESLIED